MTRWNPEAPAPVPGGDTLELLPCPFCGHQPQAWGEQRLRDGECWESIGCGNIDCAFEPETDYMPFEKAVAAWNTRAPTAPGRVKPLEWGEPVNYPPDNHESGGFHIEARSVLSVYRIDKFNRETGLFLECGSRAIRIPDRTSLASAKGAAQADYTASILAVLEPAPTAAIRAAALEEAAKVAEGRHEVWQAGDVLFDAEGLAAVVCDVTACSNIAAAIRALKGGDNE